MSEITYKLTPSDGLLPFYNIVVLLPFETKTHIPSDVPGEPDRILPSFLSPLEHGPSFMGLMLGWNRLGRARAEKKGRIEVQRYLRREDRKTRRLASRQVP